jgi:hypothetical protein
LHPIACPSARRIIPEFVEWLPNHRACTKRLE